MLSVMRLQCCGWREVTGIGNYRGNFDAAIRSLTTAYDSPLGWADNPGVRCGALLFTVAGARSQYGKRFIADIEQRNLGEVRLLERFKNPNTGRIITPFLWIIDNRLVNYCIKNKLYPINRRW